MMRIRTLKKSDAAEFVRLTKIIDESGRMLFEPGERQTTVEQQEKMIQRIQEDKKSTFLVAEIEGHLVGYLGALGNQAKRKQHIVYIALGVLENYQGKGVATSLFNEIFDWAKATAISRIELTVMKKNKKALELYKKLGFVIEGQKIHSLIIDDNFEDEYYMYKLIL